MRRMLGCKQRLMSDSKDSVCNQQSASSETLAARIASAVSAAASPLRPRTKKNNLGSSQNSPFIPQIE